MEICGQPLEICIGALVVGGGETNIYPVTTMY